MKKLIAFFLTAALCVTALTGCGGTPDGGDSIDSTRTLLTVQSYDGGIGVDWLKKVAADFEEKYKDYEFEPGSGKKGVQVSVSPNQSRYTPDTIKASSIDVFFLEAGSSADLSAGAALDITDIVTEEVNGRSLESRMSDKQKASLSYNNKYYVLPHYEFYGGLAYDIDVFNAKKLYLSESFTLENASKASSWTNLEGKKSLGPDNEPNTEDDGLPATYEEFYALCDRMESQGVVPFMVCGEVTYPNYLLQALYANYCGADEALLSVEFEGDARIITGFNDDGTPVIETKAVTSNTSKLLAKQAGKYYALEFLAKVLSQNGSNGKKAWYDRKGFASTTLQTKAQDYFFNGYLEGTPYGMLLDGSYWYNEAKKSGVVENAVAKYSDRAKNRRFGWMAIPSVPSGKSTGNKQVLADLAFSYCVINGTLKNDKNKANLAKEFVRFCYNEENLKNFTLTTGVARALDYDLGDDIEKLDSYAQSLWKLREKSDVILPVSANSKYLNSQSAYTWNIGGRFWRYTDGTDQPVKKLKSSSALTAREYFEGLQEK